MHLAVKRWARWPLLASLLVALAGCASPPRATEKVGHTSLREEGDGDDDVPGDDDDEVPGDDDDEVPGDDDDEVPGDDDDDDEVPGDDDDDTFAGGENPSGPNPSDDTGLGGENPSGPTTEPKSEDGKDSPHSPPPSFANDTDRRIFNKQSNKPSTPLENQRYYNADGSYYKPDPNGPGLWNKYDAQGNPIETGVRTADLPRDGLGRSEIAQDAGPRVWGQWCRSEQEGGFRALCGGVTRGRLPRR